MDSIDLRRLTGNLAVVLVLYSQNLKTVDNDVTIFFTLQEVRSLLTGS